MEEQKRYRSPIFWVGMAAVVVQGLCSIFVATGNLTQEVSAAIMAMFAGIFAFCNGNNPSIKGNY